MRLIMPFGFTCLLLGFLAATALGKAPKPKATQPEMAEEMELDIGANSSKTDTGKFEELKIEKSFVIEAKVERPQVQFPLLKEAPPVKDIPFEASFREELLSLPRENTFSVK